MQRYACCSKILDGTRILKSGLETRDDSKGISVPAISIHHELAHETSKFQGSLLLGRKRDAFQNFFVLSSLEVCSLAIAWNLY